jgi:hypothetical protein
MISAQYKFMVQHVNDCIKTPLKRNVCTLQYMRHPPICDKKYTNKQLHEYVNHMRYTEKGNIKVEPIYNFLTQYKISNEI